MEGAFVRGSPSDALQVTLDGTVIYNHSHVFGLVDSFNSDAIRTSSFYYDVAPARYQSPPGGTLSLVTRSGSLHDYRGHGALGRTAVSGGLEGPLWRGRASWLVSARTSLIDQLPWMQNRELLEWGLAMDRPHSLSGYERENDTRVTDPLGYEASFYDLHGKVFAEGRNDDILTLSAYSGYNDAWFSNRRRRSPGASQQLVWAPGSFETGNTWGNRAASARYSRRGQSGRQLTLATGLSYYHTRFEKDDFSYQRPGLSRETQLLFIAPFESRSELTHWYVSVDVTSASSGSGARSRTHDRNVRFRWREAGLALHGYESAYLENSLNRSSFFMGTYPRLAEAYAESEVRLGSSGSSTGGRASIPSTRDRASTSSTGGRASTLSTRDRASTSSTRERATTPSTRDWATTSSTRDRASTSSTRDWLIVRAGVRTQYFSEDRQLRWSPRLRVHVLPEAPVSVYAGYGRTYQYLYRLSLYHITTSDLWITANNTQPAASSSQFSAGIHVHVHEHAAWQIEAYTKNQQHLRLHEIDVQNLRLPEEGWPWYFDNEGKARGLESTLHVRLPFARITQTYTWSVARLRNRQMNEGRWFYAFWDRRHTWNTSVQVPLWRGSSVTAGWYHASGVPDRLDLFDVTERRMDHYSRLDLSASWGISRGSQRWNVQAGVYNVLNRQNPWYNDWILGIEERAVRDRLVPMPVEVYDLGLQASFSIRYAWGP